MTNNELNGIYLVVDPSMEQAELLDKIEQSLEGGVRILQVWNHWPDGMNDYDKEQLITYIKQMADKYNVPVLINDDWELLKNTDVHGIHFESIPENYELIKEEVGRGFITGITCSNDLEVVKWAEDHDFDYVSFCAMFPSPSVESCPIVQPETVRKAREITDMPLFLSGGITPENIGELDELDFNGVAVISGILNSKKPRKITKKYKQTLKE
jgi:thiamine-phosphate pyrophosphorylase